MSTTKKINIQQKSKIYIAGHTGMVGSAILRKFKQENYSNLILRTQEELNLLNQSAVEKFFKKEKPEFVILAAAKVGGINANMTYPANFLYENTQIQNNVIWQAHLSDVKKLLFLGSSCIYPKKSSQPIKEDYFMTGKLEPTNEGYSIAKIAGMKLCEKIYEQFNQIFISCMPTNIYGENDNFKPESSHVIPALITKIHQAKINNLPEVIVWGTGKSRREFMYVDDLANAIFWLMVNYNEKDFINIGTGTDISIKNLAQKIKKIVRYQGKLVFDTTKPDGMPKKLLDVSKLSKLGFKPTYSLEKGLQKTYEIFTRSINIK